MKLQKEYHGQWVHCKEFVPKAEGLSPYCKERTCSGEKVYYPGYGKAIIEGIEDREVMAVVQPYCILKCMERDATIMIPENMIELAGLRREL